jgi:phosphatidylglycerophosphate synthase
VTDERGRTAGGAAELPHTEGERWARNALDGLRAEGFRPPALLAFLAESFARARRTRGRRPALARQSRSWGAVGLLAAAPVGPGAMAWWAGWWAMVDWHLGMAETEAGHPRDLVGADALTLARLWAAPLARRRPHPALILAAGATDLLDGRLARRAGPTRLGRDLDSAADASFGHAVLSGLVREGRIGPRVLAAEQARLLTGGVVGTVNYLGRSARPETPEERTVAATLSAAGGLLAALGRNRSAEVLLTGAVGGRAVLSMRRLTATAP